MAESDYSPGNDFGPGAGYGPGAGAGGGAGGGGGLGFTPNGAPGMADPWWDTPDGRAAAAWYRAHPGQGAAAYRAAGSPGAGAGAGAGAGTGRLDPDDPPPGDPPPDDPPPFAGRSLIDIVRAGGLASMTRAEAEFYLGKRGEELENNGASAVDAFLRLGGLNPDSGNPWADAAGDLVGPAAAAARSYLNLQPGVARAGTEDIAREAMSSMRQGKTTFFSPDEGRSFIDRLGGIYDSFLADPTTLGAGQLSELDRLKDPGNAWDLYGSAAMAGMAPSMRNNGSVQRGVYNTLYNRYRQSGNATQPFWKFLQSVGR